MSLEAFDAERYLQDKKIDYQTEGKNTTSGWTEVNCPFCNDPSFHLGISPQKMINCWVCNKKGTILNYIQEIEKCSYSYAERIVEKYQDRSLRYLDFKEKQGSSSVKFPPLAKPLAKIHKDYLTKRGFDPDYLEKKYDLLGCSEIGDFKFRIIIPVYLNNKLVTYLGRDVTEKQSEKYKNLSVENSILPVKSVVYNIDSVRDRVLIVEGVTDVWRFGDGCVATFGTKYTKKQLALFSGIKMAFVLYDNDAVEQADRLSYDLSAIVGDVICLKLRQEDKDPADLSQDEADKIRKDLRL